MEPLEARMMLAVTPVAADWVVELPYFWSDGDYVPGVKIHSTAAMANGDLVVAGRFNGTVDMDPGPGEEILTSSSSRDIFVAKYNKSGDLIAAVDIGDGEFELDAQVAVDADGAVYVMSTYTGTVTLMNGDTLPAPLGQAYPSGAFVAKLDTTLQTMEWASHATLDGIRRNRGGDVTIYDFAVDTGGTSVYVVGHMVGQGTFGTVEVKSRKYDGFMWRMDGETGDFLWVNLLDQQSFLEVTVDPTDSNAVYALDSRSYQNDGALLRLNPSGNVVWETTVQTNVEWTDMDAYGGSIYLAGSFRGEATVGQSVFVSAGERDVVVARVDGATGAVDWAKQAGGGTNDRRESQVAVDGAGNLFLAGSFEGIADFGNDTLAASTDEDSYLSQLDPADGSFVQSWRYGRAQVADVSAVDGEVFVVGRFDAADVDFPNGYAPAPSATAEFGQYVMHFATAADPTIPRINGFVANPDPVDQDDPLTLSVIGLYDPDLRVDSVAFYHDVDGNRRLDAGTDTLLAVDSDGSDGWSIVTPTGSYSFAVQRFLAQATYDGGLVVTLPITAEAEIKQPLGSGAQTYVSDDVPVSLRDRKTVTSTLSVAGSFVVGDVNVLLDITQPGDNQLDVYLRGPDGTRVELFTDVGGGGDDFQNTTLDDEALDGNGDPLFITDGTAPFNRDYRPEGLLSDFDETNAQGTWVLEIYDDERNQYGGQNKGQLNSWSLTITPAAATSTAGSGGVAFAVGLAFFDPTTRLVGDSNDDGLFDSSDLVKVFEAGKYEDGIPNNATFDEGDWNQDGDFDSTDLVTALASGNYASVSPALEQSDLAAAVDALFAKVEDANAKRTRTFVA